MSATHLFQPFAIRSLSLSNRVLMSAMTRAHSPGGVPGEDVAAYYAARAEGGVGLIVTEAVAVQRPGSANSASIPNLHDPAAREGWKRVVDAVHSASGRIAVQLWHCGEQQAFDPLFNPDLPFESPATMTDADVDATVEAFGAAARSARDLGFDAIELHGANGYLIDQFLWGKTNRREDRWGGDHVGRTAFASAVVRAVRAEAGEALPISFRFSQFKLSDYQARLAETPEELESILAPIAEAGVDVFHASQRRFWEPEFPGSSLNLAGWAKQLTGKASITVGSVGLSGPDTGDLLAHKGASAPAASVAALDERLGRGEFDLVAVGRALLTDPSWAGKVRDGRDADLKGFDVRSLHSLVTA